MRLTLLALAASLSFTVAHAQTPGPPSAQAEALAVEIVTMQLKHINLDQLAAIAMQATAQALKLTDPKQIADLQAISPVIKEELAGMMPALAKAAAGFFTDNFTPAELVEIKAFNASPTGSKLAQKSTEFGAKLGVLMQLAMQQRMPIIQRRVQQEMRKKGHQL